MGAKITIDSATLMNKGLEIIEARWLFDLAPEQVQVIVHPQSIVHSMVEYVDGCVIAQLGVADMGIPILYALTYPGAAARRRPPRLDLTRVGALTFFAPDPGKFPCLRLARAALEAGRGGPGRPERGQRDGRAPPSSTAASASCSIPQLIERALDGRGSGRHRVDRGLRRGRRRTRRRVEDWLGAAGGVSQWR